MRICCVPFCHQKNRGDLTRSFHEFPCKSDVREKWIRIVSRLDPVTKELWQPKDKSVVCSKHFVETDFRDEAKKRILKPDVVPTVFSDYPSYMQKAVQKLVQKRKAPLNRLPLLPPVAKKIKVQKVILSNCQTPVAVSTRSIRFIDAAVQVTPTVSRVDRATQVCSLGRLPRTLKETREKLGRSQRLNYKLRKQIEQYKVQMDFLEKKAALYDKYPIREVTMSAESGSVHAQFLLEQLQVYYKNRKRVRFSDKTLEFCHTWKQYCSSRSYEYVRRVGLLELPSGQTLMRHRMAIDASQEAAIKVKEEAAAALIDKTIESVVKSSNDETISYTTELANGVHTINTEVVDTKPIFHDFAPGRVYYVTNALVENTDNQLIQNGVKKGTHDQTQAAGMPTVLQVFANDHCYYGAVPTINCPTEPVSTQLASHSQLLEQLLTTGVSSCGDFG